MSLDKSHLLYPRRRYGMDHNRYEWSMLADRKPVVWPDGKKLALWVNVSVQFFPLNPSATAPRPPGGMTMPYPDLRHFSLRDYGNRVGIYRVLNALDAYDITASFAVNGCLAARLPYLMDRLRDRDAELIAHGWDMDTPHHDALTPQAERDIIGKTLDSLRQVSERDILGWLGPGRFETPLTPDLLAAQGLGYFCDWVNDEMPYHFHTQNGALVAMPLSNELDDRFVMLDNLHSEYAYAEQICDAFDFLMAEAGQADGRILSLSLHPWIIGQPHRIGVLEDIFSHIRAHKDVWSVAPSDILAVWQAQTDPPETG